jgi:S-adenosylhomocysteine hydrolase
MSLAVEKKNKHLILNQTKLSLAKKILGARTETETIERALDSVISESERNEKAVKANESFLKSKIEIKDVFGNLER